MNNFLVCDVNHFMHMLSLLLPTHTFKEKAIHWLNMRLPVFAFTVSHKLKIIFIFIFIFNFIHLLYINLCRFQFHSKTTFKQISAHSLIVCL